MVSKKQDLSNLGCSSLPCPMGGRRLKPNPKVDRSKAGPEYEPVEYEDEAEEIKPSLFFRLLPWSHKK